jgi:hypothetical protein
MSGLRARVHKGRLVVDEPTDLPEGTVLDLVVDDEGDDMDDAERAALDASIARALDAARAGKVRPAADVVAELRRKS